MKKELSDPPKGVLELLAELDELEADAEPGPWFSSADGMSVCCESPPGPNDEPEVLIPLFDAFGHTDFLCKLRNAYPQLRAALTAPSQGGRWVPEDVLLCARVYGSDGDVGPIATMARFILSLPAPPCAPKDQPNSKGE